MESQDEDYADTVSDEGSTCSSCIDIDKLICVAESALDDSGFIRSAKGSKMSTPSSRSLMHPEAYIVPCSKCTWDIFLSHKQSNAQDAMQSLRMALSERILPLHGVIFDLFWCHEPKTKDLLWISTMQMSDT